MKILKIHKGTISIRITADEAGTLSRACGLAADELAGNTLTDKLQAVDAMETAFLALAAAGTAQMHLSPPESTRYAERLSLLIR